MVINVKDVYFSDLNDDDDDIPVLTPEERRMIQLRRQQKLNELNGFENDSDSFYSRADQIENDPSDFYKRNYSADFDFDPDDFHLPENKKRAKKSSQHFDDYDYDPEPPKREKKKKRGCFGTLFVCFLLIAAIICASSFAYVYSLMNETTYVQSQANNYVSSAQLKSNQKVKNILLIGLDTDSGYENSRSDTMMLLSVDTQNKELKLTSFLRDMWVDIPNHKSAKLNAAYNYGGAQLTMDTIEYNFEIDIDNYILVNFDMFRKIVDSLGGITVEITEKEAAFINKTTKSTVNSGLCELDGKKALIYARIRKLDSDFQRTQRQRKIINAIIDKATKTNPVTLLKMVSDIMPLLTTDIKALDLTILAFSAIGYLKYDINQLQVPADDAYVSKYINGQSALVADIEKNKSNLYEFIYS